MAFYKKSKLHTGTALICSLAIVFSALPVYATDTIDNLQNQTSALENELKGINQDILTLSEKISDTEMQVEILNSDIDKTQDDLEKAQKNEDQQYEDMKSRIKYMYEHGSATMLEMLFSAENMSDFLNKADFIENLSNYDRKALNNLKDVHQQIADQKADLEAQQASMKDLQNQLQTQQTQLQAKAEATSTNLNEVNAKLQKAKEEEAARQAEEARKQAEQEKLEIARRYLVPKQMKANGVQDGELVIQEAAVRDIVRYYSREAGVRNLDREIARICRKVVKGLSLKKYEGQVVVTADNLNDFLGVRKYSYGEAEKDNQVGQVNGLAWTEVGGDLLTIEAAVMNGKGAITRTGSLGDVMKESVEAARTVVRSRSRLLGIKDELFDKRDIHIHVPEGATPKDGPSAGIAMTTALVSSMTGIPVRCDVAMTGEITLRGEVLPIGGLKEKLLAAVRGGLAKVLIPEENVRDLAEIPDNIKNKLEIVPVKWIDQVLELALERVPQALPEDAAATAQANEKSENPPAQSVVTH